MKIRTVYLFCMLSPLALFGQQSNLDKTITFKSEHNSLIEVINAIEKISDIRFSYNAEQVNTTELKLPQKKMTVNGLLDEICKLPSFNCSRRGDLIILQIKKKKGNTSTLQGVIRDSETGEFLVGTQVVLMETGEGAVTNNYGFFSITQPTGSKNNVEARYIGYEKIRFSFSFISDSVVNLAMTPNQEQLDEVLVTSSSWDYEKVSQSTGMHSFTGQQIKRIAAFGGVADPLKAIQFLPGIQTSNEGTVNFSVRGGSFDQNLFLLDEAPVYNPSHSLSFFSVFNADAIQRMDFYKSAIPVRYGGRLSSVVDVHMIEGNRMQRTGSLFLGTLASGAVFEGPLVKKNENISFMLAGRYSYAGALWNGITKLGAEVFHNRMAENSLTNNDISFYDMNMKLNFNLSDKDRIYVSGYLGKDIFFSSQLTNGYAMNWGNATGTVRWNHIFNKKIFVNTTMVFSRYNYSYEILNDSRRFNWSAQLKEVNAKQDFEYSITPRHSLLWGWNLDRRTLNPGQINQKDSVNLSHVQLPLQENLSFSIYAGDQWEVKEHVHIQYGLRFTNFALLGPGVAYHYKTDEDFPSDSTVYSSGKIIQSYSRAEPRIAISFSKNKSKYVLSYDRTNQFLHLLSNSSIGLPTDVWVSSSQNIEPQSANIYAAKYETLLERQILFNIGMYYKQLYHTLDFKDNANLTVNRYVESQVLQGGGRAYGIEFQASKKTIKWEANLSYTWSKVLYNIPGINNGKDFPTRFDKRHNLSVYGLYKWSPKWETSINFVFTSGGAVTVPAGSFQIQEIGFNYYTQRNGYRLPAYHRMDISIRYHPSVKQDRKWKSYWSLDVYNVYSKKNPFLFYSIQQDYDFQNTQINTMYLFGIFPSITYHLTF